MADFLEREEREREGERGGGGGKLFPISNFLGEKGKEEERKEKQKIEKEKESSSTIEALFRMEIQNENEALQEDLSRIRGAISEEEEMMDEEERKRDKKKRERKKKKKFVVLIGGEWEKKRADTREPLFANGTSSSFV